MICTTNSVISKLTLAALALAGGSITLAPVQSHGAEKTPPGLLKKLEGNWRGKGKMKPYVDSKPEPVSCSARYHFLAKKDKMQLQLNCASVNAKSQLVAFFEYGKSDNGLTGSWFQKWSTADVEENGSFKGSASASSLDLDIIAGGKKRAEISVSVKGPRDHSVSVAGYDDGKKTQSFSIAFKR